MDDKDPDELLQQLHDAINKIQKVDEKGGELLRDLDGDIRDLLARSGEEPLRVRPSIIRQMERAISYFEVTHPDFTALISDVMSSLSNAGI